MPASTPFLGLYKPGGGSTGLITPDEVVDIDRLNTNADLIDAFAKSYGPATERNHQLYGPAASLSGVTGMKLGDTYQESDGNKVLWKYDGTNWVTGESGMYLIRPTSVVNGTVSAKGTVVGTPGASSSLSVNGVFSSRYDKYVVHFLLCTTGSGPASARLRNAGSDVSGASSYYRQAVENNGTGAPYTAGGPAISDIPLAGASTISGGTVEFSFPARIGATKFGTYHSGSSDSLRIGRWQGNGLESTSYDGFTLFTSGGTWHGSLPTEVKIYAYA